MRFPIRFAKSEDALVETIRALTAQLDQERQRNQELVDRLVTLQRQGFTPPPVLASPTPKDRLPREVRDAIASHCHPAGNAYRESADYARGLLERGAQVEDVVRIIHQGRGGDH